MSVATAYPHEVEKNDPAKHRQPAGPAVKLGWYLAYPVHGRDGLRWWVENPHGWVDYDRQWGSQIVRVGGSFDEVASDFIEEGV